MQTENQTLPVWDLWIRLFHASLILLVLTALLSEDEWLKIHVVAGFGLCGLLLFRLIWGFIGSQHARFRDFIYPPKQVIAYLRTLYQGNPPHHLGHNPAGGMMVLLLLITLTLLGLSGLLTLGASQETGLLHNMAAALPPSTVKPIESLHEGLGELLWALIALHLGGVLLGMWQHKENLIKSMIHGNKQARS
ncbi:cytochrome B561 [Magnetococcus marinus MC-1]|uniref:Cytochrome B561 n=1 Tax=Magnetococcus marinus (strain ATCC BAA-1437 / JCM 17883 / MC-1) TaxID=156889 RepID=A0L4F0_MAGMM|nr:cytochrome b/b6 domain-containing protein [Magnetococcus marinus]ABK42843.1 cytochrome B561 [Magnetococcus marinus MC-1]